MHDNYFTWAIENQLILFDIKRRIQKIVQKFFLTEFIFISNRSICIVLGILIIGKGKERERERESKKERERERKRE